MILAETWQQWLTSPTVPFWPGAPWGVVFIAGFTVSIVLRMMLRKVGSKMK